MLQVNSVEVFSWLREKRNLLEAKAREGGQIEKKVMNEFKTCFLNNLVVFVQINVDQTILLIEEEKDSNKSIFQLHRDRISQLDGSPEYQLLYVKHLLRYKEEPMRVAL